MVGKQLIKVKIERERENQKWGFSLQGGQDHALTMKIAGVKKFSPASLAGLQRMDYVYTINGKEVFSLTQQQAAQEVLQSGLCLLLEIERGDHIVPSFQEIWPQLGMGGTVARERDRDKNRRQDRMCLEYVREAMKHHGLGHMPQPDNFTTCGSQLGIKINQYNAPIECYADGTIEDMRDDKILLDCPKVAEKFMERSEKKKAESEQNVDRKRFRPELSAVLPSLKEMEIWEREVKDRFSRGLS